MDLETQRLENLKQKQQLLSDLNLESKKPVSGRDIPVKKVSKSRSGEAKRRKLEIATVPLRKSARVSDNRPNYNEDRHDRYNYVEARSKGRKSNNNTRRQGSLPDDDVPTDEPYLTPAANIEDIRAGWTNWKPTGSPVVRDDTGQLHFDDFPRFIPNKSPEQMIREGCFGGSYFRPLRSKRLGVVVESDWEELPHDWYEGIDVDKYMISPTYDAEVNKFKVSCGQSIEEWEAAGWISLEHDIRGWFQWYCRFYMGRRCDDDVRQVGRWERCVGKKGRWRRLLLKKYVQMDVREVFDYGDEEEKGEVSPVMHQTCHHWAYEVRQEDLDEAWKEFR